MSRPRLGFVANRPAVLILLSAICYLLSALSPASAQSFFSSRGFGEEIFQSDATSSALGGLFSFSPRNPACPLGTARTSITGSILAQANYGVDGAKRGLLGDVRPDFLRVRVPLPAQFRLGLGLSERYNQNFDVRSDSYPQYRRHVVGKGGVYDVNASLAWHAGKVLSLGLEYDRLFGGSSELWRFDAFEGNYTTFDTIQYNSSGNGLTGGLVADFGVVALSGFLQPTLNYDLSSWVRTHGAVSESAIGSKVKLPARFGAGLTVAPTQQLDLYLEGYTQAASGITIRDSTRPSLFRNSLAGILGVQYMLDEVHPLRLGVRYSDWYLKTSAGLPVREVALTGGSSLPIKSFGSFDFSAELIHRSGGTLQENIIRANLTLYYEEAWKARRRRWGY